jgi:acyl carrier protein
VEPRDEVTISAKRQEAQSPAGAGGVTSMDDPITAQIDARSRRHRLFRLNFERPWEETARMTSMTTEATVTAFLKTRFHASLTAGGDLGPDAPLFTSGIVDSFGVLEVIAFLEDTFDISIDMSRHELTEFDTVNRIAGLVERARRPG